MKEIEVILVDNNDNEIGVIGKTEAHAKALLHRAVSVFICNTKGEWLLQRRAFEKYHSGGLWTNSCCSHPMPGESDIEAASRRLRQEIGLCCDLKEIFSFIYKEALDNQLSEYELDHVFIGICDDIPTLNEAEVCEYKYISYSDLIADVAIRPESYTVWFKKIIEQVKQCL